MPTNGMGWDALETVVDELVEDLMQDEDLPGLAVAVTSNGRLLLAKGYGYAYRHGGIEMPMTPSSRFKIGSVTKAAVTGPAAWQVMQAKGIDPQTQRLYGPNGLFGGRFDADIDIGVQRGISEGAPGAANWKSWYQQITVQHLFDHRAGLKGGGSIPGAAAMFNVPQGEVTYEQAHRHFLRTHPLLFEPGTAYDYSNHGMGMMTLVIEQLSSMSYLDYAREKYLKPMGLHGDIRPERAHPDSCDAYKYKSNGAGNPVFHDFKDSGIQAAAGGYMASMLGLARLLVRLSARYTPTELDRMGWRREPRGKLEHGGLLGGGTAYAAMFPDGYVSTGGVDLGGIHIAVATNIRKSSSMLEKLANEIVLAVPASNVPASYDLWKQGELGRRCEYSRLGVPAADYQAVFDGAVAAGQRLEWIDGYTLGGKVYYNAIFRTSDRSAAWVSRHGMTGARYQQYFDQYVAQGYSLVHVDSFAVGGEIRYAAIWSKSGGRFTAYHGKSAAEHQKAFDDLTKDGWRPAVLSVASLGGKRWYTGLYTKESIGAYQARSFLTPAQYQAEFDDNAAAGRHLRYLNSYVHQGKPYFTAIWAERPAVAASRARHGLTEAGHRDVWRDALGSGMYTHAVTGYEAGGAVRYAAYWTR